MIHKIRAQERYLQDHACYYRTIVPLDLFDPAMLVERAERDNMAVGDPIYVQFMDKGYTIGRATGRLLAEAEYRIIEREDRQEMIEIDDRSRRQVEKRGFKIVQIGQPRVFFADAEPEAPSAGAKEAEAAPGYEIRWNVGAGMHQLVHGDDVLFESKDKEEVQAQLEIRQAA